MKTYFSTLVLGATGSLGYAFTVNLLQRNLPVTILVRNRGKAEKLFSNAPTLTIAEGDAQNADLLKQLAVGKDFIFHGINYPYPEWFGNMDAVTRNVIEAAATTDQPATIVFPGNIYNFGNSKTPIREESQPSPCTRKGQLRVDLEAMLKEAATKERCNVLNVRLPDFWGPNVLNEGIRPIFEGALTGKAMPWIANARIAHQAVYTPDAAEVMVQLMQEAVELPLGTYQVWNYGGEIWPSARWFFEKLTRLTGKPLKVRVYPPLLFRFLGLFSPMMRELTEMLYLFENTVVMDDEKLRKKLPDFQPTPLEKAMTDTLAWFAETQLSHQFQPVTPIDGKSGGNSDNPQALNLSIS
ncbi:NAD(P)H-binding protein [Tellurirhabdus bombi]|uniref:NAD(P)H-binding protein n=1 Tax=Tellurirhabdus bombi TaxID=2907205 RepID=UPI001F316E1C|nr:NAD(P)H-binding protein [Tellurirhabdus bombi]